MLIVIFIVIYSTIKLKEQLKSNQLQIYSKIVFLCTFGFIVCVVVISKIIQHFKTIKFEVQQYYPRNTEFNNHYLKLLVQD
ncbi:unnamed protein product [Paramecium sonneborni]|nr:unnamed protein product [Paramecium sonneborni]